jgi:hypothetical protein
MRLLLGEKEAYADCFYRLQGEAKRQGIEIRRGSFESLDELFTAFPSANAYFNCTGLGAYSLKGVQDKNVYPTRVCPGPKEVKHRKTHSKVGSNHARGKS